MTIAEAAVVREIGAKPVMQHRERGIERRAWIDDRRQWLIIDLDQFERILREVAAAGNDDPDRLADIAHALDRDRPAFDRSLHADNKACRERGYIRAGQH